MVEAGHRANEVLEGVRRLFAGGEPEQAPVDINDLIDEVVHALRPELEGHMVETRLSLDAALPQVAGNRGQLQEVIMNLINNAREAMDAIDGRRILKITTERTSGGASIVVEDWGPGISPEAAIESSTLSSQRSHGEWDWGSRSAE